MVVSLEIWRIYGVRGSNTLEQPGDMGLYIKLGLDFVQCHSI